MNGIYVANSVLDLTHVTLQIQSRTFRMLRSKFSHKPLTCHVTNSVMDLTHVADPSIFYVWPKRLIAPLVSPCAICIIVVDYN